MVKKSESKPVAAAVGATLAISILAVPMTNASDNPFGMTELSSGYMVAYDKEGKCGEGKCGENKGMKHRMKNMDTNNDGAVSKDEFMAHAEKKFAMKDKDGDGVISAEEMSAMKKHKEGKCGEKNGKK